MVTIDNANDTQTRQSLIQHFDRELQFVRQRFEDVWTQEAEFHLQSAKVYLFALNFLPSRSEFGSASTRTPTLSSSFRVLLLSGVTAAVRLIHVFSEMGEREEDASTQIGNGSRPQVIYYPKMYFGHICMRLLLARMQRT